MHDVFGWLTIRDWTAILRIGVGLWWLESVRHKNLRSFLRGDSMNWVAKLAKDHPIPAYGRAIETLSLSSARRRVVTSWLVVLGEFSVGVSLLLGLLTPVGAVVGVFLNANYFVLAGVPGDYGEQGQNLMMLLIEVVVIATSAGAVWGVDGALFK